MFLIRTITWPALIGAAVAAFGFGCLLTTLGTQWIGLAVDLAARGDYWFLFKMALPLFAGLILLFLAYPLFRARDWARRALLSLLVVVAVTGTVLCFRFSRPKIAYDNFSGEELSAEQLAHMRRGDTLMHLSRIGGYICVITVPTALAFALLHPSVVDSFRRRVPRNEENI